MPKARQTIVSSQARPKLRAAMTPTARENQLISLAIDVAEEQLRNGTASSAVITHYLKLGSSEERLKREILERQKELITAKTKSIQSAERVEELYTKAIEAMQVYSGHRGAGDDNPDA